MLTQYDNALARQDNTVMKNDCSFNDGFLACYFCFGKGGLPDLLLWSQIKLISNIIDFLQ